LNYFGVVITNKHFFNFFAYKIKCDDFINNFYGREKC